MTTPQRSQLEWDTAMHQAAVAGKVDALQSAILAGADVNSLQGSKRKSSALADAILAGKRETAVYLLQHGADPNLPDGKGFPPLTATIASGKREYVSLLLDYGADPNQRRITKDTTVERISPLEQAVKSGRDTSMRLLLHAGADPLSIEPVSRKQARNFAGSSGAAGLRGVLDPYEDMPRTPVDASLDRERLFAQDADGNMPMQNPVMWRKLPQIVEQLAKNGEYLEKSDLRREDQSGVPVLYHAISARMLPQLLQHLNAHGENLLLKDFARHPVLETMLGNTYVLRSLFTKENLMLTGVEGYRESLKLVPEGLMKALPGKHAMMASLSFEAGGQQRGR